jgi:hypothetical protein
MFMQENGINLEILFYFTSKSFLPQRCASRRLSRDKACLVPTADKQQNRLTLASKAV